MRHEKGFGVRVGDDAQITSGEEPDAVESGFFRRWTFLLNARGYCFGIHDLETQRVRKDGQKCSRDARSYGEN